MKKVRNQMLVKAVVIAENGGICANLSEFRDSRVAKFKIKSFDMVQAVVEVNFEFIVLGEYEDSISVLKRLNRFLTNEELNYRCGYCEIKTIPAEYEVVKDA